MKLKAKKQREETKAVATAEEKPAVPKAKKKEEAKAPAPKATRKKSSTPTDPKLAEPLQEEALEKSIQIQCNTILYDTIQNMITSAHTAGDYTFGSVADVIRSAIAEYENGMQLTEVAKVGETKTTTTLRISTSMHSFYKSWKTRLRSQILERVIRTYLKTL